MKKSYELILSIDSLFLRSSHLRRMSLICDGDDLLLRCNDASGELIRGFSFIGIVSVMIPEHKGKRHVAVIGAGTAGLCAAKHAIQNGFDVTVFERANQVGGTWVYTDNIGMDKFGLQVHTSMYQGLQ